MAELDPRRWKALAVVAAAYFMTILDVAIVNVALPTIGKDLNFSRDDLQWVVTAYAITFGGFLLLGGRAADILGRRRVFLVGVVVFTTASLFCGLAWSEGVLIAARAVQGFGARFSMITNIATKPQTLINLLMSSSDETIVVYTKATIAS